eukprot:4197592-Pleurochrysis_carterae.AAC.1
MCARGKYGHHRPGGSRCSRTAKAFMRAFAWAWVAGYGRCCLRASILSARLRDYHLGWAMS